MHSRTDGAHEKAAVRPLVSRLRPVWIALLALCVAAPTAAAQGKDDSRDEVFEKVDPYTGGTKEGLDRAGYVSLGPFPWCEGVRTEDIEEVIGRRVLWVETAHFKLGSTLETYRSKNDKKEDKKLADELERLAPKLGKEKLPRAKIDPWLRLHLYAQRLEDTYAWVVAELKIDEKAFAAPPDRWKQQMGEGPYLGLPMKFTVLLTEKTSSQGRFLSRWMKRDIQTSVRERMPGGTLSLVMNAEVLRGYELELDAVLHCAVASDITLNLLDGFRSAWATPFWFKQGMAHAASRRVDERWTIFAKGTMREKQDSWKWEPRVYGLVANDFVPSWKKMIGWTKWEDIDAAGHMACWSRVTWLLSLEGVNINAFLMDLTEPVPSNVGGDRDSILLRRQEPALQKAFGKSCEELDAAWRAYVTKNYSRR
jgi:hypothetical protein